MTTRLLAFVEMLRYLGYNLREIASAIGVSHDLLRQRCSRELVDSPLELKRETLAKDHRRSAFREVAEYLNAEHECRVAELRAQLVMDGSAPPYAPEEPYLFNALEYMRPIEARPISAHTVRMSWNRMTRPYLTGAMRVKRLGLQTNQTKLPL